MLHIEYPKESTRKTIRTNKLSKMAGYKIKCIKINYISIY